MQYKIIYMYIYIYNMNVFMFGCTYAYTIIHTYIYIYIYTHVICSYLCVCENAFVYEHICLCMCFCTERCSHPIHFVSAILEAQEDLLGRSGRVETTGKSGAIVWAWQGWAIVPLIELYRIVSTWSIMFVDNDEVIPDTDDRQSKSTGNSEQVVRKE